MLDETVPVPDHTALAEARESLRWNGSLWDAILTYHRVADEQAAKKSAERPTQHDKPREAEQALARATKQLAAQSEILARVADLRDGWAEIVANTEGTGALEAFALERVVNTLDRALSGKEANNE